MDDDVMRSILSAVDFSEHSRRALRWAGAFAAQFQSRLTVISVVDPLLADAARIRLNRDLATTEIEPALREFVAATWPSGAPTTQVVFRTPLGAAATAILDAAASDRVDLIVVGTQGLGGIEKWLLGSTTERLLRQTQVPVLAVPSGWRESRQSNADGIITVRRILAATDFSEPSLAAVKYAAQLVRHFSATLILAHAVEPLTVPAQWRSVVKESEDTRAVEARTRLKSLAEQSCSAQDCEAFVSVGRAADVIGSLAEDHRADLIVMGLTSAQGAFAPRPGSIAYRVLSGAALPVLVVPFAKARAAQE
jgi:nucleotide-binding universal stress UspA family protein